MTMRNMRPAILTILAFWFALYSAAASSAPSVPHEALAYQRTLVRQAHQVWGLNAPVATMAAQIHQESAWNPNARSPYADGLSQFTPGTADWIAKLYPQDLGDKAPYSPQWAIAALVRYDRLLYEGTSYAATECDRWAMTLSSYNGGAGWLNRDRRLCAAAVGCDPSRWWWNIENYTGRAAWAKKENRGYPRRILLILEPVYLSTGWPGTRTCT